MDVYEQELHETKMNAAIEASEMTLVATLKPKICIDGNQWCVLWGDNLQDGAAGFGDSPHLAMLDFNKEWKKPLGAKKGK